MTTSPIIHRMTPYTGNAPSLAGVRLARSPMQLFFIVCALCVVALPLTMAYFTGSALLGALGWAVQTLRLGRRSQCLLLGAGEATTVPEALEVVHRLLDSTALSKRRLGARYLRASLAEHTIHLRTQTCAVNPMGQPVSVPLNREQRSQCEYASCTWMLLSLPELLPPSLQLHVQWMPDENVLGSEALAAGLLDHELQSVLRVGDQFIISDGQIGIDSPFGAKEGRIPAMIAALSRTADRLAYAIKQGQLDVGMLLIQTATADPGGLPEPRAKAVDLLLSKFYDHPGAEEVRASARRDPSPDVRFAAARHLGEPGYGMVEEIVFNPEAREGLRQHALRYLIRNLPADTRIHILEVLLQNGPERLRQIAIRQVARRQHRAALPLLVAAASSSDLQTRVDIAEALGQLEAPEGEAVLVDFLQSQELPLRVCAAEALGRAGTLTAIQPLHRAAETNPPNELRVAALSAVHSIQSRSGPTATGALSLAEEPQVGGLSLPASESPRTP